jgi:hypothetical protein
MKTEYEEEDDFFNWNGEIDSVRDYSGERKDDDEEYSDENDLLNRR